jgi:hypothetical protein
MGEKHICGNDEQTDSKKAADKLSHGNLQFDRDGRIPENIKPRREARLV